MVKNLSCVSVYKKVVEFSFTPQKIFWFLVLVFGFSISNGYNISVLIYTVT